jgi:hypothetical protein
MLRRLALFSLLSLSACVFKLSLEGKHACTDSEDCLEDRVCLEGLCVSPSARPRPDAGLKPDQLPDPGHLDGAISADAQANPPLTDSGSPDAGDVNQPDAFTPPLPDAGPDAAEVLPACGNACQLGETCHSDTNCARGSCRRSRCVTVLPREITEDTRLVSDYTPYWLEEDLRVSAILTIESKTAVWSDDRTIQIQNGALVAKGTKANPVVFSAVNLQGSTDPNAPSMLDLRWTQGVRLPPSEHRRYLSLRLRDSSSDVEFELNRPTFDSTLARNGFSSPVAILPGKAHVEVRNNTFDLAAEATSVRRPFAALHVYGKISLRHNGFNFKARPDYVVDLAWYGEGVLDAEQNFWTLAWAASDVPRVVHDQADQPELPGLVDGDPILRGRVADPNPELEDEPCIGLGCACEVDEELYAGQAASASELSLCITRPDLCPRPCYRGLKCIDSVCVDPAAQPDAAVPEPKVWGTATGLGCGDGTFLCREYKRRQGTDAELALNCSSWRIASCPRENVTHRCVATPTSKAKWDTYYFYYETHGEDWWCLNYGTWY